MKWSEIFLRYLEKNFEIFRKKKLNFRKHIRRFFVIFVSRPRSALKRFIKICVRRPSVRSEQIKIFIETFLECSSRYTLKELSLFIAFLKTTSKLITFSQRSIKLLVGIFFLFFIFFFINRDLYYHYITYNTFTTKFKVTKNYN